MLKTDLVKCNIYYQNDPDLRLKSEELVSLENKVILLLWADMIARWKQDNKVPSELVEKEANEYRFRENRRIRDQEMYKTMPEKKKWRFTGYDYIDEYLTNCFIFNPKKIIPI